MITVEPQDVEEESCDLQIYPFIYLNIAGIYFYWWANSIDKIWNTLQQFFQFRLMAIGTNIRLLDSHGFPILTAI